MATLLAELTSWQINERVRSLQSDRQILNCLRAKYSARDNYITAAAIGGRKMGKAVQSLDELREILTDEIAALIAQKSEILEVNQN